jgi:hypothetical protein
MPNACLNYTRYRNILSIVRFSFTNALDRKMRAMPFHVSVQLNVMSSIIFDHSVLTPCMPYKQPEE